MLRMDFLIEGEEEKGPIDLEASLTKLREMLERADDAQRTTVTVRLSPIFAVGQMQSGPGWEPSGQVMNVWQSRDWVVYRKRDEGEA